MRRTTIQIINQWRDSGNLKVQFYNNSYDMEAKTLLDNYASYLAKKGVDCAREIVAAHLFFFDDSIEQKIRLMYTENGALTAISFFTPTKDVIFWNAVINEEERNLMRFVLWQSLDFMKGLLSKNFPPLPKRISLQGSEVAGQDCWKQSFRPLEIIKKTHMVNLA
jgi:hypothetical protein